MKKQLLIEFSVLLIILISCWNGMSSSGSGTPSEPETPYSEIDGSDRVKALFVAPVMFWDTDNHNALFNNAKENGINLLFLNYGALEADGSVSNPVYNSPGTKEAPFTRIFRLPSRYKDN